MTLGPLRFTNALGGTADFIYPGPTVDMQSPASAGAVDGATYLIYAQSFDMSQWEISTGVYTASSKTLARTTVKANSLGTAAKINFGDPPQVFVFDTSSSAGAQPGGDLPLMDGVASAGASALYSREDHVHPTDTSLVKLAGNQTITGGYKLTPSNRGNISGAFTPDPTLGNYQYGTNHGAITFNAPANDCAMDILLTNDATAGAITFSGYTVNSNTGEPLTTTNASKFIVSVRRINAVSTYMIKALQ